MAAQSSTLRKIWQVGSILSFVTTSIAPLPALALDQRQSTVGMPARIDQIVLPGPELEAKPLEDDRTPIVLRIANAFTHGTAFRYDIVYYGLEPGKFDLKAYLQRRDGSSMADVPSILVEIEGVLPAGHIEPNELEVRPTPYLGGYWTTMIIASIVWAVGLAAIIYWMVAVRIRQRAAQVTSPRHVSLADRLRPIVEQAISGNTNEAQLAELERLLLTFWRRRLRLEELDAAAAIVAMRQHEEAGHLLRQLEIWLHRPGTAEEVDVATLLRPYQNLPADAIDSKGQAGE